MATAKPKIVRQRQPVKATSAALKRFREAFAADMGAPPVSGLRANNYEVIPTGSLAVDAALGIGGLVRGRVHEFWGPEHAGKTTLGILTAVQAQKTYPDQMVGIVDMEQTFDWAWAVNLGLDPERTMLHTPEDAEDTADAVKRFIYSGMFSLVTLDSVGGMISRAEMEKEAEDEVVAKVAKIVTRMVKIAAPAAHQNGTTVLVINQVRSIVGANGKGPDTHTSGGWALKHITTTKSQVRRGERRTIKVRGEDVPVGYQVNLRVEKNKVAPAGRKGSFWLANQATEKYGPVGVDTLTETVELAKEWGIIEGSTWLTLPNGERFQGIKKATEYLREHPDQVGDLRAKVLESVRKENLSDDAPALSEEDLEVLG